MKQNSDGMVSKRGWGLWLTHAVMIVGVLIVFFPLWLAFVASTVTQPEIVSPPMPVWPGEYFWKIINELFLQALMSQSQLCC